MPFNFANSTAFRAALCGGKALSDNESFTVGGKRYVLSAGSVKRADLAEMSRSTRFFGAIADFFRNRLLDQDNASLLSRLHQPRSARLTAAILSATDAQHHFSKEIETCKATTNRNADKVERLRKQIMANPSLDRTDLLIQLAGTIRNVPPGGEDPLTCVVSGNVSDMWTSRASFMQKLVNDIRSLQQRLDYPQAEEIVHASLMVESPEFRLGIVRDFLVSNATLTPEQLNMLLDCAAGKVVQPEVGVRLS